jgi:pimeloyl-ACP methyl ester carboxylesterase
MLAELTDARCYYELIGSGDPLVLIPGLGTTCAVWDGVAPVLAESFSLVLLDNRGVGRSAPKAPPRSLRDMAVDVIELMDHVQIERAHIMGLSLGGMIAQQVALDHPSRVDRLVLASCTNRFGPYLREMARLLGHAVRHFPSSIFRRTIELLGTAPEYLDAHTEEIEHKIATARRSGIPRSAVVKQLRCLGSHDVDKEPEYRITAPTLVLAGDQDMLIPACYARQMSRDIGGSEFKLLAGCGHNPFTEQPDVVVPLIVDFLMRGSAERAEPWASEVK